MTNANGFIEQVARRAQGLPLARIVAAMLGLSAAFFALAMPPRIVSGLLGLTGLSVAVGAAGQLLFAILFALLAAAAGWLAITLLVENAAPTVPVAPAAPAKPAAPATPAARKRRAVPAQSSDPAPTLRRGDAHPDAPARRPIFAKDDLGTPFDEIVTDRRIVRGAPEAEFATPDAPVDLDATVICSPPLACEAVAGLEAPVEDVAVRETPSIDEPAVAEQSDAAPTEADEAVADDEAPPLAAPSETPAPCAGTRPDAPREDDSIAALMARLEGGLGRLGGSMLPPPDPAALGGLKRSARNPDDALRDALDALQQMAARQR